MAVLTSLGGAGTVTGSKHLLESGGRRVLVDCGLFQGLKALRLKNWDRLPVPPQSLDAVVLTHAHLDHCGWLPRLVAEGFNGPIYATPATCDLSAIILRDSAHLHEKDADYANRKGFSKHHPALPLYTVKQAEHALKLFVTTRFHDETEIAGGARLSFRRAGHILGAATAKIRWDGLTIAVSGDLGRYDDPVMVDPEPIEVADYLLVESTYGDRRHDRQDPTAALGDVIERTTARGGTVVIPTFAVGRAQALLFHIWKLKQAGRLPLTPVYLDSPMAENASDLLLAHMEDHRLDPDICRAACKAAIYVRDVEESKAVSASRMPKVILSASGMATGGRVLHHIRAFGPDPKNTILFSGFQAAGTRGRSMLDGERSVKMFGGWVPIRAEVADLPMLSAHGDANEILRWLGGFRRPPRRTFVVHGEPQASAALQGRITQELGWDCVVQTMTEPHEL